MPFIWLRLALLAYPSFYFVGISSNNRTSIVDRETCRMPGVPGLAWFETWGFSLVDPYPLDRDHEKNLHH
jgi:hypothetical protein